MHSSLLPEYERLELHTHVDAFSQYYSSTPSRFTLGGPDLGELYWFHALLRTNHGYSNSLRIHYVRVCVLLRWVSDDLIYHS